MVVDTAGGLDDDGGGPVERGELARLRAEQLQKRRRELSVVERLSCGPRGRSERVRWLSPLLTGNGFRLVTTLRPNPDRRVRSSHLEMTFSAYFSMLRILFSSGSVSGPTM